MPSPSSLLNAAATWLWVGVAAFACSGEISSAPSDLVASASAPSASAAAPRIDAGSVSRPVAGGSGGSNSLPGDAGSSAEGIGGSRGVMAPGGSGGAPASEEPCDAVGQVLTVRCGGGSCHSNPGATIGDFAVGVAEAESYVNVPSVRNPVCGVIIDPLNPSQSLLLRKVVGDFPSPTCGGAMPVTGAELTNAQIACLASWLQKFDGATPR